MSILTQSDPDLDLLAGYRPHGSFFFRSPRHTLLAQGVHATVPSCNAHDPVTTLSRVRATLDAAASSGHPRPIVVGALPFHGATPARLTVPGTVRWAGPRAARPEVDTEPISFATVKHVPEPEEYMRGVSTALSRMQGGPLEKIVLSRSVRLQEVRGADTTALLRRLVHNDPEAYVFAADLLGGRVLLGASPELLVRRSGALVSSFPLAGSAPRLVDPALDDAAGRALLGSDKDLREHAVVVRAVAEALDPFCAELTVPEEPSLVRTATMWHLGTEITGRLASPETSSLHLAMALHPTPAICGTPTALARRTIGEIEEFDRGFYSGSVGWCDASGDGEWAVTIRCAEVSPWEIRLYAGAGIVPGSTPEGELAETSAKFRTLLRVLGVDRDL
ncbi:isochorismate synthase [Actinocorallia sp. A-T 12471]|uniref:isochorismate synthase n=1 Tax=Actinocorallia sp. A-T 12471 TaxID=3089813 RepID=UPI0029D1B32E|nr:isochorismate synthase [Actinocorallia sp. A-T 12471]MDX6740074.1 isochorismate synthase [Actinocorallia sp. A-T 12471]